LTDRLGIFGITGISFAIDNAQENSIMIEKKSQKIALIGFVITLTLGIHYGWLIEPFFRHVHWLHALHGRFCYIPIVISASWFGLRGGIYTAGLISVLVLPYILGQDLETHEIAGEFTEIVFYFAIALLTGALIDRELFARKKHQEAQLQLERSQKLSLVGKIAAGVAHEIKNPLASIKGAFEIIFDRKTSDKDKGEFQGIIMNEIKRIDNTVKDFLNFARPKETALDRFDLSQTLDECLRQVEIQAAKSGVEISKTIEEDIRIMGDKEKIHQAFLNLLLNSLDASEPELIIDVKLKAEENRLIVITIRDYGIGIERDALEHIFDPFYTTKTTGTGLGLPIVKSIIENHNGTIKIESEKNEETCVSIELPSLEEKKNVDQNIIGR